MKIVVSLAAALLLLTACRSAGEAPPDGQAGGQAPRQPEVSAQQREEPPQVHAGEENSALYLIAGLEEPDPADLAGLKNYRHDMRWMEANAIEHLERWDGDAPGDYYLLVPRYNGSTVTVESLDISGGAGEVLCRYEDTPDSFGLVLNTGPRYGAQELLVRVSLGEDSARAVLSGLPHDGETDHPVSRDGFVYAVQGEMSGTEDIALAGGDILRITYRDPLDPYPRVSALELISGGETFSVCRWAGEPVSYPAVSPGGRHFAYIDALEWEVMGTAWVYDAAARSGRALYLEKEAQQHTPKQLLWLDDETLLLLEQYAYGTITLGGEVYVCTLDTPELTPLFTVSGRVQISGMELTADGLCLDLTEYTSDEYDDYERGTQTVPLPQVHELVRGRRSLEVDGVVAG